MTTLGDSGPSKKPSSKVKFVRLENGGQAVKWGAEVPSKGIGIQRLKMKQF